MLNTPSPVDAPAPVRVRWRKMRGVAVMNSRFAMLMRLSSTTMDIGRPSPAAVWCASSHTARSKQCWMS